VVGRIGEGRKTKKQIRCAIKEKREDLIGNKGGRGEGVKVPSIEEKFFLNSEVKRGEWVGCSNRKGKGGEKNER